MESAYYARESRRKTMPGMIGWPEMIGIAAVILVLFGARRLPEVGKSLGSGIREFKKSITGEDEKEALEDQSRGSGNAHTSSTAQSEPAEKK
jgi:TatA/E family protein of Tat protein translocase